MGSPVCPGLVWGMESLGGEVQEGEEYLSVGEESVEEREVESWARRSGWQEGGRWGGRGATLGESDC